MNKKGNFWFWTGLVALVLLFIVLAVNLKTGTFSTTNIDSGRFFFLFVYTLVTGLVVFISASLS